MNKTEFIIETCMNNIGEYLEETQEPYLMVIHYLAARLGREIERNEYLEKIKDAYEQRSIRN